MLVFKLLLQPTFIHKDIVHVSSPVKLNVSDASVKVIALLSPVVKDFSTAWLSVNAAANSAATLDILLILAFAIVFNLDKLATAKEFFY